MRVVADTNVIISGIFWRGAPRAVLDAARDGRIEMFTSAILLAELEDVLSRPKFAERLTCVEATPRDIVLGYASLAYLVEPAMIEPVIEADPDDDQVLACAVAAKAGIIVSGDSHLLNMKKYNAIEVISATELQGLLSV
ncbi:MAG: putative toxin-antitoxin system toxin component, PIN family [Acidobacteria bacterium]|nr:putative toxin-antitoxin system toxin component, PIN family [Acidobacteriota bacterium]